MDVATLFQQAVLDAARRRFGDSLSSLEKGVETAVTPPPDWRLACAALHVRLGDEAAARTHLQAAVEAAPDYAPGWILLGLLLNAGGDVEHAADALARAPELLEFTQLGSDDAGERDKYMRRVGEGQALQKRGNAAEAVELLSSMLTRFLPGCKGFMPVETYESGEGPVETPENGEQPLWPDVFHVATAVYNAILVTHLGEPVMRALPEPDLEPEPQAAGAAVSP